jgi:hypothetical protein
VGSGLKTCSLGWPRSGTPLGPWAVGHLHESTLCENVDLFFPAGLTRIHSLTFVSILCELSASPERTLLTRAGLCDLIGA